MMNLALKGYRARAMVSRREFFHSYFTSFRPHYSLLEFFYHFFVLIIIILAVTLRRCWGKHSCTGTTFSITILDGPFCFLAFLVVVMEYQYTVKQRNNDCFVHIFLLKYNIKINEVLKI